MASATQTRILEVCRVRPSSPPNQFSLPLTFFDICWLGFSPVKSIYFYKLTAAAAPSSFNSIILPKLKRSLSLALLHFLPLAGNLTWPPGATKPIILYTPDDAVTVTVVESTADFDRLSSHEIQDAVDLHPYVPALSKPDHDGDDDDDTMPNCEVQITSFPGQGFSIGLATSHAVMDARSALMFVEAWAHICKHIQFEEKPPASLALLPEAMLPFYDRGVVKDPEGLDMEYLKIMQGIKWPDARELVPPNSVRATFELSREHIRKLRERVLFLLNQTEEPQQQKLHLSAHVLAYAYTVVCLVKAKGLVGNTKVLFGITADCRTRLDPPIPSNYFGNCLLAEAVLAEAEVLVGEKGMAFAAQELSELIKGLENGGLERTKKKLGKMMTAEPGTTRMFVAGSSRLDLYGTDFGWGTPTKVEITSIDGTGAISMMSSKKGEGAVDIGVVLKKPEMDLFHSLFLNGLAHI